MRTLTIETSSTTLKPIKLEKLTPELRAIYASVRSNQDMSLPGIDVRGDFRRAIRTGQLSLKPVVISASGFVPKAMVEHLMRNKKDSALGVKYEPGDKITWMEGALHTFLTPLCPIVMSGDYEFKDGHQIRSLNGKARVVILSASIQPDFESAFKDEVIMKVVKVQEEAIEGQNLGSEFLPLWQQTCEDPITFQRQLQAYETLLQKHMIYHLTSKRRLPSLKEVQDVMQPSEALTYLDLLIESLDIDEQAALRNQFINLHDHVVSLEALFSIYLQLVRNEFSILEALLPQGYVYTIDPPAIFASQIGRGNVNLLNRLQTLAFRALREDSPFTHLKIIGFNDYADKAAIALFKIIFPDKKIVSKSELFSDGHYSLQEGYALVLHNNSDAFGQNIETEGANTSLDGAIGSYSDASCQLQRDRADLLDYIF
ncbi:MAG: hypothetical protein JSS10_01135 [Verrucomicrobia bacterium]|nr:hypothetical protein [Verrucomicrobiota bacterium]